VHAGGGADAFSVGGADFSGVIVVAAAEAWVVGVWELGNEFSAKKVLWLVPVRDHPFAVWLAGFVSNRVNGAGVEYAELRRR